MRLRRSRLFRRQLRPSRPRKVAENSVSPPPISLAEAMQRSTSAMRQVRCTASWTDQTILNIESVRSLARINAPRVAKRRSHPIGWRVRGIEKPKRNGGQSSPTLGAATAARRVASRGAWRVVNELQIQSPPRIWRCARGGSALYRCVPTRQREAPRERRGHPTLASRLTGRRME